MRSSRCGEARPVRTVASSPRLDSTDLSIRLLGVLEQFVDQLHWFPSSLLGGRAGDQRAHLLAADDPIYVAARPPC